MAKLVREELIWFTKEKEMMQMKLRKSGRLINTSRSSLTLG
jgi:hypothetical protein